MRIPSTRKPPPPLERHEMLVLAQYLDARRLTWMHCPNESKRSARFGAELKRMGMKSGFPDVAIFTPPPGKFGINGVAIELKRQSGSRVSTEQRDWLVALEATGWKTAVCFGASDAIAFLNELYPKNWSPG